MKETKDVFKKIFPFLILGIIIRLILMPVTLHPDLWAVSFSEYLFAYKGVINIYDYLATLPQSSALVQNYGQNFFTYPPLSHFTFGIFGLILKPLFNSSFFNSLDVNLPNVLNDSRVYLHLFLVKLPYLFFDIGVLILLSGLFDEPKKKQKAVVLWLFMPLAFYTSFMVGQFDIIPVFFTILSLCLAKKNKWEWAAISLGIGGAYKMFPLFFLPFLAIYGGKKASETIKLFIFGLLPYFLTICPFLGSPFFRQNVLFSTQSQKMLFARLSVSGAEYLSVFIMFYIFFLGIAVYKRMELWKFFTLIMLLFFSVTHYHPQWFLWLAPFLVIFWVEYPKSKIFPAILLTCWFLITILFEPSLSISLFAPLEKNLQNVVSLSQTVNKYYDVFLFKSLVRSVFAGVSLTMAVLLFKKDESR